MAPERLTLAVTHACNLHCGHCYVEAGPGRAAPDPPPGESLRRLIADFVTLGGLEVCLTGGEPLARPDWFELLAFACRDAVLGGVFLQTNATLVDDAAARAIASLRCNRLVIQVSLEGARAPSHDLVRGAGSFERVMAGIEALARAGLRERVAVAFTEMRHNIGELPELLEQLEKSGVRRLTSASVTPHGRAANSREVLPPEPEQVGELVERYREDADFRGRCLEWADVAAVKWWEGRGSTAGSACALIRNPYVSADGWLYPCPLLHDSAFAVPGVFSRPLARSVVGALERWRTLQEFSATRATGIQECRNCSGRAHCGGGCMGRAHMFRGELLAPEDRCALRKVVYGTRGT